MKGEISPIEIIKATPKNNCGECGFDTCMAFATSVVRKTVKYDKCPYLQPDTNLKQSLEEIFKTETKKRAPGVNALTNLEKKLLQINLKESAKKLGLIFYEKNYMEIVKIKYLDTDVELHKTANSIKLTKENKEEVDIYDKILILNYLYFAGEKGLTGEWVGMEGIPNSISKVKALEKGALKPFREFFSKKLDLLEKRIKELPHKILNQDNCIADICAIIYVFPMLPIRINFWDASDEDGFEAEVKYLYDKNVMNYLDLESLVFASEKLTEKIIGE